MDGRFGGISRIDGKTDISLDLLPNRLNKAKLTPGEHTLDVRYGWSRYTFKLVAEPGHGYLVKYDTERTGLGDALLLTTPGLIRLWIADAESGNEVGTVLETQNEPLPINTTPGLPDFFKWSPPQMEKRMFISRHIDGLTIHWKGARYVDSYSVMIRVYELPDLKTAEEFADHVRKKRQLSYATPDEIRFKDLEESVEMFAGGADFCVKSRHVSMVRVPDKDIVSPLTGQTDAVLALTLAAPMLKARALLESSGYNCRIPTKKGYGIDFEYSHQSGSHDKDAEMAEQADMYFGQLKF